MVRELQLKKKEAFGMVCAYLFILNEYYRSATLIKHDLVKLIPTIFCLTPATLCWTRRTNCRKSNTLAGIKWKVVVSKNFYNHKYT